MLRIAIQTKGRLHDDSMQLLAEAGIKLTAGKRLLLSPAKNFPCEILFLRDDDIPQSVADGVADIGIVGENEFLEKDQKADIIKRLGYSKCRVSLAIPKGESYSGPEYFNGKKIATSYPVILQKYLDEKGIDAEIHEIMGSVEIAPGIGLADAIFDIVSSGGTLVSNGLKEVETVVTSEAVMIGNKKLTPEKLEIVEKLNFRIDSVQRASGKKYIVLNAPTDKIPAISELLPGVNSPSIMPLALEGWSSISSVIEEKTFWDEIDELKKLGAEGILVMPIEKMIL